MCLMNFAINGYTKEYMSILKDGLGVEYTGRRALLEYEIQLWDFFIITEVHKNTLQILVHKCFLKAEESQVEIRIVFRRNIQFHLFGTFLQQIMLLAIGYLTFYFEVSDFTVSHQSIHTV